MISSSWPKVAAQISNIMFGIGSRDPEYSSESIDSCIPSISIDLEGRSNYGHRPLLQEQEVSITSISLLVAPRIFLITTSKKRKYMNVSKIAIVFMSGRMNDISMIPSTS